MVKKSLHSVLNSPNEGYCNICNTFGLLTRDHIPPKGSIEIKPIVISRLSTFAGHDNSKTKISRNGLKIRSICGKCNNDLLGGIYDPEFIIFTNQVATSLRLTQDHQISLPKLLPVTLKTQKVARSIIGHLLAGHPPSTGPITDTPMYGLYRKYFLDKNMDFPDSLEIYFWLFPSRSQGIAIGHGITDLLSPTPSVLIGDILKLFPFGFWVVFNKPDSMSINQQKLVSNRTLGFDSEERILVDITKIPKTDWPENPGGNFVALFNNETTLFSRPRLRVKKKKKKS